MTKLRLSFFCALFCAFALASRAEVRCDICGEVIHGHYYYAQDTAIGGRYNMCAACAKLEDRCFICSRPVKENGTPLPDGRVICARDFKTCVQNEDEAKQLCEEVKLELDRVFSGYMTFPDTNALVSIVNQFYLQSLAKQPREGQACVTVNGATTSTVGGKKIIHSIAILSHLTKARLMAVCAHELTHAWMRENVTRERAAALDKNTTEAFCELIAYKYMDSRSETFEMESIKKNNYTKGKILTLIAADNEYGFNAVVNWIKSGDDRALDLAALERVRAVDKTARPANAEALVTAPAAFQPAPAPGGLALKSIVESNQRRFALINTTTFETNEERRVHVGADNVTVRCLEIRGDSVIIQVNGSPDKKQLFLRPQ